MSYGISPDLPAGLNFDTSTGAITGTPTAPAAAADYTITATNSAGSAMFDLSITVNDVAPSNLSYSTSPAIYTYGTTIAANTPTSAGGAVVSYGISPDLPAGLNFDTSTGVITGMPTALSATTSYTITATNSGGSTMVDLSITVNDVAPSNLSYSTNPAVYTIGVPITANTPTSSGGAVVSYGISPDLPAGLNFDTSTGVITGTPMALSATTSYTITATNSGGSTMVDLSITVNDVVVPPSNLSYSTSPAVYTIGVPITANTPTSSSGAVVSYGISPALPADLNFDTSTGVITGTPMALAATTSYTITATNSAGSTMFDLSITINDVAPSNLSYSTSPAIYTYGTTIAANTPTSAGGAVVSYGISPNLPAGLNFDTSTGAITGTPMALAATTSYAITATNSGGSTMFDLSLTVNPAPLSVTVNSQMKVYGAALPTLTGTLTGVVNGDNITVTYATTATSTSDVVIGGYPITATLVDPDGRLANYTVTNTPGTLTITPAVPTVLIHDPSGVVTGQPYTAIGTASGVGGAALPGTFVFTYYSGSNVSGTPLATAPTSAGTYTVSASFAQTNPDYQTPQPSPVTFTIAPFQLASNGMLTGNTQDAGVDSIGIFGTALVDLEDTGELWLHSASGWKLLDVGVVDFKGDAAGTNLFILEANGNLRLYQTGTGLGITPVATMVQEIAMADNGNLYYLTTAGALHTIVNSADSAIDSGVASFQLDGGNNLYELLSNGTLYQGTSQTGSRPGRQRDRVPGDQEWHALLPGRVQKPQAGCERNHRAPSIKGLPPSNSIRPAICTI